MNILVKFIRFDVLLLVIVVIKLFYYGNFVLNFVIYLSFNWDFRYKILCVFFCKCGQCYSNFGDVVVQFWVVSFCIIFGVSFIFQNESVIERSNSVDGEFISIWGYKKDENSFNVLNGIMVMCLSSL